jgi:hypothetical protein
LITGYKLIGAHLIPPFITYTITTGNEQAILAETLAEHLVGVITIIGCVRFALKIIEVMISSKSGGNGLKGDVRPFI